MKPIKSIAGKVLLYFYLVKRTDYAKLYDMDLKFQMRQFAGRNYQSPVLISKPSLIIKDLLEIAGSDNNLYNALKYLEDKGFIEMAVNYNKTGDNFLKFLVVSAGVDVIEGIERGKEEKEEFNVNFNIKVSDKTKIENLLEKQLGSLYKAITT